MRREKGITLISLIITIIVMLILIAVTVNVLIESGIIGSAKNAANKTQTAYENEAVLNQVIIGGKVYNSIEEYRANGGQTPPTSNELKPGEIAPAGNGTYKGVTIPAGFTVSGIADEQDPANGLVIYDIPANELADVSWTATTTVGTGDAAREYPTVQTQYNQFVWVPVETAYVTADEINQIITSNSYTDDTTGTTKYTARQKAINYLISQGKYPMAVQIPTKDAEGKDTVMYRGILYKFAAGTNGVEIASFRDFSILDSDDYKKATYLREPAFLTGYSCDNSSYNKTGFTEANLQEEYDLMVKSVKDNGGFFVARYELTREQLVGSPTFGTKRGKEVAISYYSATGEPYMWYGLYEKCQNMYKSNELPVQSTMISGAQWDQIMIWLKDVENKYTNSSGTEVSTYYVIDSTFKGNLVGGIGGTGDRAVSGYEDNYSAKEIFDLCGNCQDCTTEAGTNEVRIIRGNWYNNSDASARFAASRFTVYPATSDWHVSARTALYLK